MRQDREGKLHLLREKGKNASLVNIPDAVRRAAVRSLTGNLLYAVYHGVLGVTRASLWFGILCAFYSILAAMRCFAVLYGRGTGTVLPAYGMFRTTGLLLLVFGAVLAWSNAVSLSQNIAKVYGTIPMITIASYTFYKITAVIVRAVRQRKHASAQFTVLQNISYAEVAASVLTLQRSMLVTFGRIETEKMFVMNALTGAGICLFILVLGMHMILRYGRRSHNGKIETCKGK